MTPSSDISLCQNDTCPSRLTCRRFTQEPARYQSYCDFKPDKTGRCDSYWTTESLSQPRKKSFFNYGNYRQKGFK